MATITNNGQSYLEIEGIDARKEQTSRSDYNRNDEYNEQHPDALATGDEKGKGTGDFSGHSWIVPDMTKPRTQMSGLFNTDEGGNDCDYASRRLMTARSIYGPGREYGKEYVVDTTANVNDGQYDGATPIRIPYTCPLV